MAEQQEAIIISAVLDGQPEQYRFLVERYYRGLIRHLYGLVNNEQAAEDIAQEAFLQAYNKLSQYNHAYAFSTWLYKIADNFAYKHLKKQGRLMLANNVEDYDGPDELAMTVPETVDREITKEAVRQAVETLPVNYQQVISMYYWDDFNYEEISRIIGHPVGTVRTWLFRAKEQLRKELYGQIG